VAEYHLLTTWRIEAPLEEVYAVIERSLSWPDWWPSVRGVQEIADGRADGIGNVRRYVWQGKLPYRVVFDVRATHIEQQVRLEGSARGDLEGVGRWSFSHRDKVSIVKYDWHVCSNRWWMNLVAPVARSIFILNHTQIMEQGGQALARLLKAPLVAQESVDLMAKAIAPATNRQRERQRGRIGLSFVLLAGLASGVIVTFIRLAL
jgi:hypothetical protein